MMQDIFKRYKICIIISWFISLFCFAPPAAAGAVQSDDFSYQGVSLGDTEQSLHEKWGAASFEKTAYIRGIRIRACTYGETVVSVAAATGKVVDIALSGDQYRMRGDVRKGATRGWLFKVYGKAPALLLDDQTCYVYTHPSHPHWHLVLNIDSAGGYLTSARITMLPLTDEEADAMVWGNDDDADALDLDSRYIASKEIDVSALPKEPPARLGGYGK